MTTDNLTTAHIAIIISSAALFVSAFSLAWNIYREIGLKARVKVGVAVVEEVWNRGESREKLIMITAVNFGPGTVILIGIDLKPTWWSRRKSGVKIGSVVVQRATEWASSLPAKLEVGEQVRFTIPYDEKSFLKTRHARIGVRDSFRRNHWARRKRLREAEAEYRKDFPETK